MVSGYVEKGIPESDMAANEGQSRTKSGKRLTMNIWFGDSMGK
jgi:hypothetical protein